MQNIKIFDGMRGRPFERDDEGGMVVIDQEHHEIHEGVAFVYDTSFVLASNSAAWYSIKTPTVNQMHFLFSGLSLGNANFQLFEGSMPATSIGCTTITVFNRNRTSANVSGAILGSSPSIPAALTGTAIYNVTVGYATATGAFNTLVQGDARGDNEWVLKSNCAYFLRVLSGNDLNNVQLHFSWYETHSIPMS